MAFGEDLLVQQTTADYLRDELGWESVYAYNDETFGREGTLGRRDDREVVLTRYLGEALVKLNPDLPQESWSNAACASSISTSQRTITSWSCASCGCAAPSTAVA